jgi:hypothetical protein
MQSNIIVPAYKKTCTIFFVLSSHFTGAIKELRKIKDAFPGNEALTLQDLKTPKM